MSIGNVLQIDKLSAAERQLREAIFLFFERRDPIAIHTLATASHRLLVDLGSGQNVISAIKNSQIIRVEYIKQWQRKLSESGNFFKHADRDTNATLEFDTWLNELFMVDAIEMCNKIARCNTNDRAAFLVWFGAAHPEYVNEGVIKKVVGDLKILGWGKEDFGFFLAFARQGAPKGS